jgi:hypothetical protein
MELLFWSIVGGLVGTGLMDIAEEIAERSTLTSRGG